MTNDLRQRLVGAAVITAIAAIFLPMLFDDPVHESSKTTNDVVIPAPPQVSVPEGSNSNTSSSLAYPSELATEQNESKDSISRQDETETLENNEQAETQKPADRMTVAELAALKDKKEREKILKDRIEGEDGGMSSVKEKSVTENKLKERIEKNNKEKIDVEGKVKEKLDIDKKFKEIERKDKDKLAFDKKTQERSDADLKLKDKSVADKKLQDKLSAELKLKDKLAADKKIADKLAKEKLDYQKLAAKKTQEKTLADKKAAEKLAFDTQQAAKQQALDDKAAASKIAADKLAAQKAVTASPTATRWFIRVGSYAQESNAYAFRDVLRKQGYPAVVDIVKSTEKGKLYRLRVGPELSKAQAEKILKKMDTENNSKSIIELE